MSPSSEVLVIDYGVGNTLSVLRALEHVGHRARLTSNPDEVARGESLILPGVGAFGPAIGRLDSLGLSQAIVGAVATGARLLGICLGMQLLLDGSSEFGDHSGLGLIPGRAERLPEGAAERKVPHVGWSRLRLQSPNSTLSPADSEEVYFVHSYHARTEPVHTLAITEYAGLSVTAAVGSGRVLGCQFHPEKSGPTGLGILSRFLAA